MSSHFWGLTVARCFHFLIFFILSPQTITLTLVLSHLSFSNSPSSGSDGVIDDYKWRFVWWLLVGVGPTHGSDCKWRFAWWVSCFSVASCWVGVGWGRGLKLVVVGVGWGPNHSYQPELKHCQSQGQPLTTYCQKHWTF